MQNNNQSERPAYLGIATRYFGMVLQCFKKVGDVFYKFILGHQEFNQSRRQFLKLCVAAAVALPLTACADTQPKEQKVEIEYDRFHLLTIDFEEEFLAAFLQKFPNINIQLLVKSVMKSYVNEYGCNRSNIRIGNVSSLGNAEIKSGPGFIGLNLDWISNYYRQKNLNTEGLHALLSYFIYAGATGACTSKEINILRTHIPFGSFEENGVSVNLDIVGFSGLGIVVKRSDNNETVLIGEFNQALNFALANSRENKVRINNTLVQVIERMVDNGWITLKDAVKFSQLNNVDAFLGMVFNKQTDQIRQEHYVVFFGEFKNLSTGSITVDEFLRIIEKLRSNNN